MKTMLNIFILFLLNSAQLFSQSVPPPRNLTILSINANEFSVTWLNNSSASEFRIEVYTYSVGKNVPDSLVSSFVVTKSDPSIPVRIRNLQGFTRYWWTVRVEQNNRTLTSNLVTGPPVQTLIKVLPSQQITDSSICFHWQNTGHRSYEISIALDRDFTQFLDGYRSTIVTTSSLCVNSLRPSTNYWFRVRPNPNVEQFSITNQHTLRTKFFVANEADSSTVRNWKSSTNILYRVTPLAYFVTEATISREAGYYPEVLLDNLARKGVKIRSAWLRPAQNFCERESAIFGFIISLAVVPDELWLELSEEDKQIADDNFNYRRASAWVYIGSRHGCLGDRFYHYLNKNITVGVQTSLLPDVSQLHLYPNPTSNDVVLHYYLLSPARTTVEILDMLGHKMYSLPEIVEEKGEHNIQYNTEGLSSGMYMVRLSIRLSNNHLQYIHKPLHIVR